MPLLYRLFHIHVYQEDTMTTRQPERRLFLQVLHGTGLRVTVLTLNFAPVSKVGESRLSSHSLSYDTEGEDSEWD